MSDNHFRINKGLSLVPQASAPANPVEGDIYFDATLGFQKYQFGAWTGISGTGRLPSTVVTTDTTMDVNNVYIVDSASLVSMTLPATNDAGDEIIIIGSNTGKWRLKSNAAASQTVLYDDDILSYASGASKIFLTNTLNYSVLKLRGSDTNEWVAEYHSGTAEFVGNYFGTGADGAVTISSNTNLTSTTDSDMIVKNYTDLTVNSGCTLTVSNRCKGLLIYVKGNLVVNGSISMTKKGANVDATSAGVDAAGLKIRRFTAAGADSDSNTGLLTGAGSAAIAAENNQAALIANGTVFVIPRAGAGGGGAVSASGSTFNNGTAGSAGTGGQTGGGGGGGAGVDNGFTATSGAGTAGTCFSGGSAGGGCGSADSSASATAGTANGGAGGGGGNPSYVCGAGAGNPGGTGFNANISPEDGTGGLLIIIVKGNVTIGGSGTIEAKGGVGGGSSGGANNSGAGGGSGGGSIVLLYAGSLSNSGSITAAGGAGGQASSGSRAATGGAGGAGSVQSAQIGE